LERGRLVRKSSPLNKISGHDARAPTFEREAVALGLSSQEGMLEICADSPSLDKEGGRGWLNYKPNLVSHVSGAWFLRLLKILLFTHNRDRTLDLDRSEYDYEQEHD
jgi:hypothetical protein